MIINDLFRLLLVRECVFEIPETLSVSGNPRRFIPETPHTHIVGQAAKRDHGNMRMCICQPWHHNISVNIKHLICLKLL